MWKIRLKAADGDVMSVIEVIRHSAQLIVNIDSATSSSVLWRCVGATHYVSERLICLDIERFRNADDRKAIS